MTEKKEFTPIRKCGKCEGYVYENSTECTCNTELKKRPSIENCFPKDYTPKMLNDKFLAEPNLYGYIQALDEYIDYLEENLDTKY